jgi:xanthine dehydrogenase accessory factor
MRVWGRLAETIARSGAAAMVTIAATRGSSPREAGARMVVDRQGGFSGTIGGGTLEWQALAMAQAMLSGGAGEGAATLGTFLLGPDMGQCCGGRVELLFERFTEKDAAAVADLARHEAEGAFSTEGTIGRDGVARHVATAATPPGTARLEGRSILEGFGGAERPLLLFGAGHVGRALVMALAPLPFAVTWYDPRAQAFPPVVPANVRTARLGEIGDALAGAKPGSFALVMTHSHQLDLAIVHGLLADDRFAYVGLIGSLTKRVSFERRLGRAGLGQAAIARLVCPIGVAGIKSKLPAAIAAATVAELLIRDEAVKAAEHPAAERRHHRGRAG